MPEPRENDDDDRQTDADTWPWRCLGCGGTIYHDGELCRGCRQVGRHRATDGRPEPSEGFLDWMRRQSAPSLSLKVSVVAGVELVLTSVWLRLLLGASGFAPVVP